MHRNQLLFPYGINKEKSWSTVWLFYLEARVGNSAGTIRRRISHSNYDLLCVNTVCLPYEAWNFFAKELATPYIRHLAIYQHSISIWFTVTDYIVSKISFFKQSLIKSIKLNEQTDIFGQKFGLEFCIMQILPFTSNRNLIVKTYDFCKRLWQADRFLIPVCVLNQLPAINDHTSIYSRSALPNFNNVIEV